MSDPYNLQRFVDAQDAGGAHDAAIAELHDGRKRSHWMWFVFPQIAGLGRSPTAVRYAISGLPEARAYLAHPTLGGRLRKAAAQARDAPAADVQELMGGIDAVKLRSSMTLFGRAAPDEPVFAAVLQRWYDGVPDRETDGRLR